MNFHINTKALEALSYADLVALSLQSKYGYYVIATEDKETERVLRTKINQAIQEKIRKQGIITFFQGDNIEVKPITDNELSARSLNAIRQHFGLKDTKEITVQHLKVIHEVGVEYVRNLGVACQREIEQCLKDLGLI